MTSQSEINKSMECPDAENVRYIYTYIYVCRGREREREGGGGERSNILDVRVSFLLLL
jgi:hypothetical protein